MEAQALLRNTTHNWLLYLQKFLFPTSDVFEVENTLPYYDYKEYNSTEKHEEEPLEEDYNGLLVKYFINQHGHLWVRDYEMTPIGEYIQERPKGLDPTKDHFYYTLVNQDRTLVALGALQELDAFPFADGAFFDIAVPLNNDAKWLKIYRNGNLLLSHVIPTSDSCLTL
ncbi:hypothetical protein [Ulvibacterium sp.]|uniref:hypothetical protein n=1 Tax=Ulvibacterium sp. TaxID=2665914 RepID=UPI00261EA6DD|nr:hypothetical protein [Ulvibacterium sp.]